MSRQWTTANTGQHYIQFSAGAFAAAARPITVAMLWRPNTSQSFQGLIDVRTTTGTVFALLTDSGSYFHNSDFSGIAQVANSQWTYLGLTIPASNPPRWHIRREDTGAWVHANASNITLSGTIAAVRVGYWDGARLLGHVAATGLWESALSDGDHEAVGVAALQDWLDSAPSALWAFNQASLADPVLDLTGGGADETAEVGTMAVSATEPPGWSYELDAGDDHEGDGDPASVTLTAGSGTGTPAAAATGDPAAVELVAGAGTGTPAITGTGQPAGVTLAASTGSGTPATVGAGEPASITLAAAAGVGTPNLTADGAAAGVQLVADSGAGTPALAGDGAGVTLTLTAGAGLGGSGDEHHTGTGQLARLLLSPGPGVGAPALSGSGTPAGVLLTPGLGRPQLPGGDSAPVPARTPSAAGLAAATPSATAVAPLVPTAGGVA